MWLAKVKRTKTNLQRFDGLSYWRLW